MNRKCLSVQNDTKNSASPNRGDRAGKTLRVSSSVAAVGGSPAPFHPLRDAYPRRIKLWAHLLVTASAVPLVWYALGPWLVEKINYLAGLLP